MKKKYLVEKEREKESARDFNTPLFAPSRKNLLPVTPDYDYMRSGALNSFASAVCEGAFLAAGGILSPIFRLKIVGRENLCGVGGAIITSNHISPFDCALVKRAVGRRRMKITVADFNNWDNLGGAILRASGTMPMGGGIACRKNLSDAIKASVNDGRFVLFYPEGALWWCYEKPRPLLDGAFYSAAKNNVPVVPMFFTFEDYGRERDGIRKKRFTLHIGKPIYPDTALSVHQNTVRMKELTYSFNLATYIKAYGHEPEYLPEVAVAADTADEKVAAVAAAERQPAKTPDKNAAKPTERRPEPNERRTPAPRPSPSYPSYPAGDMTPAPEYGYEYPGEEAVPGFQSAGGGVAAFTITRKI